MDEKKRMPVAKADGWIPVQEGLPKKSDYYLVTRGRKRITTMLSSHGGNGGATACAKTGGRTI